MYILTKSVRISLDVGIPCSGPNSIDCNILGETCVNGFCKCGSANSCEGRTTGSFCDAAISECRCSQTIASCSGLVSGSYCDEQQNICKCSDSVASCSEGLTCSDGECIGNS